MTLRQEIQMMDNAAGATERISYGNDFIDAGTLSRQREELGDLHARRALTLEAHPELRAMNAEHQERIIQLEQATEEKAIARLRQECAELARQIIAIEESVDLD